MTDPLSITCGITSLASAACNLCSTIYQTIDSIRGAPKQIRNLSIDLRGLYSVLGTLKGYLDDEEMVSGVMHPATSADLEAVLSNCAMIFKDINAKVNGFQRAPGTSDLALWRRLQWNWKEKGVVALRARLANHTRTLINTRNTTASTQQIEEELRQLRAALARLLEHLNDMHQERGAILDNYSATTQRFAQSAKSIITTPTIFERPPSPSIVVSYEELVDKADQRQSLAAPRSSSPKIMNNYKELVDKADQKQSLAAPQSSSPNIVASYQSLRDIADQMLSLAAPQSSSPNIRGSYEKLIDKAD
ncbi:MAG: hypothetical protein MMC33_001725 [Icmadophila ericetorum]|nr:hypothetical protein [Icmadophila ericetorum]